MQGPLYAKNAFSGVLCFLLRLNSIPQRVFAFLFFGFGLGFFFFVWFFWGQFCFRLFLFFIQMDRLTTMKKMFVTTFFLLKGYILTRTPKRNSVERVLHTREGRCGIVGKICSDQRLADFLGVKS